jgi:hypothetical protein
VAEDIDPVEQMPGEKERHQLNKAEEHSWKTRLLHSWARSPARTEVMVMHDRGIVPFVGTTDFNFVHPCLHVTWAKSVKNISID